MNDIAQIVRALVRRRGQPLALATLVRATGSSYRRPGARMLITRDGECVGSLSAGCLEDEVAVAAREVIASGAPRLLSFDTRRRFGCNGSIEIFVERPPQDFWRALEQQAGTRECFFIATRFEGEAELGSKINAEDAAGFVQPIDPAIRLIVIGSGPDGAALALQAQLLGWQFVALESVTEWQAEIDDRTAAVIATHNYGRDCAALRHLLPLGLPYLGLIGPRRRRDELLVDVIDSGAEMASNLFAPAGLHLESDSPAEIALAIAAEIQAVLADGSAVSLRDRKAPIHQPISLAVGA